MYSMKHSLCCGPEETLIQQLLFIDKIKKSKSVRVFWIDEGLFEKALVIFQKSDRKSWSFTDCTSFALMQELSISEAFTFDRHFREAGFLAFP